MPLSLFTDVTDVLPFDISLTLALLTLSVNSFNASAAGQVLTETFAAGRAGNIVIKAIDSIMLSGKSIGIFASTAPGSTGNGGNIQIEPQRVLIQDGATIAVDSNGSGTGGSISLQAGKLELSRQGAITAETASAQGGNITLDVKGLIVLRHNSLISATAGTAQAGGDGGNITVRAPFIIDVLGENSDITANAFTGNGGNINITTSAIYGLQFQPQLTPFSDITASSQFGINGTVTLNLPNVDPSRGLVALPAVIEDVSKQIAQGCSAGGEDSASRFALTGRGGLPANPEEPLNGEAIWRDDSRQRSRHPPAPGSNGNLQTTDRQPPIAIVPAIGWDSTTRFAPCFAVSPPLGQSH